MTANGSPAPVVEERELALPPGPKGRRLYHTLRRAFGYREFLDDLRGQYGDVVSFRNLFHNCCAVFDAESLRDMQLAQRISSSGCPVGHHNPVFVKNHMRIDFLPNLGINQADGEPHQRMVRIVEPVFARDCLDAFADVIIEDVHATLEAWRPGKVVKAKLDLTQFAAGLLFKFVVGHRLDIAPKTVAGGLLGVKFDVVLAALPLSSLLKKLPLPEGVGHRRAITQMEDLIRDSIRTAHDAPGDRADVIAHMVQSSDEEKDEPAFTDAEVRDIAYDLMLASIDPTGQTVVRAISQMSRNPATRDRFEQEIDEVLGDRAVTVADFENLPYTRAIVHETLRLGPTAYAINRACLEDYTVGNYRIPEGTWMEFCFGAASVSDGYWDDPWEFRPDRWLGDDDHPPHHFTAFGYRPHLCIGWEVATMAVVYFLAAMGQRFRVTPTKPLKEVFTLLSDLRGPCPVMVNAR